jgi:DNA-directed RNA polymerase I, II, and III subunit RPABC1
MEDWSAWAPQLLNVQKMFAHRGYGAVRPLMHGADPLLVCSCRTGADTVFVYFLKETKVGVRTLRNIQQECEAAGGQRVILVTEDGLTPFAAKELEGPDHAGEVEVFKRRELAFCLVEHSLVPKHELLSAAERRQLLQKLRCKATALPRLKEADPVARFYRFPIGGVVRIHRNIGTSNQEIYYRLVAA